MFNLKTKWETVDCTLEELECRLQRENRRIGRTDCPGTSFFAGGTLDWPTTEILSTDEATLNGWAA